MMSACLPDKKNTQNTHVFLYSVQLGFKKEEQLRQHCKSKDSCSQQKYEADLGLVDCPTQRIPKKYKRTQKRDKTHLGLESSKNIEKYQYKICKRT